MPKTWVPSLGPEDPLQKDNYGEKLSHHNEMPILLQLYIYIYTHIHTYTHTYMYTYIFPQHHNVLCFFFFFSWKHWFDHIVIQHRTFFCLVWKIMSNFFSTDWKSLTLVLTLPQFQVCPPQPCLCSSTMVLKSGCLLKSTWEQEC